MQMMEHPMAKMETYLFFRDGFFYPVEEENDEKVLKHIELNPGTRKITTAEGRVVYDAARDLQ
jgi:hypothetical protein